MSWEFWNFFFMILSHLCLLFVCWSIFAYGLEFAEIFACATNSAVSMTQWSQIWCILYEYLRFNSQLTVFSWFFINLTQYWWPKTFCCWCSRLWEISWRYKNCAEYMVLMTPQSFFFITLQSLSLFLSWPLVAIKEIVNTNYMENTVIMELHKWGFKKSVI